MVQRTGEKATGNFIIDESTTPVNERDTGHPSLTTAPVTSFNSSSNTATLTPARATDEASMVIKPPAEKTNAGQPVTLHKDLKPTSSSREAVPTLKTTSAGRTEVSVLPRSSQREQSASAPTATKKPGESKPVAVLKRADGRRSPSFRPREYNDRTVARRTERDDRRTSLVRPAMTSQSRSRSPIRRPSDVGGTYVSRNEYEDFIRWKKIGKN
jgi:hypothetical protein